MVIYRPETAEGQLLPCPTVNRNGENWENESTSSAASNTEYTGAQGNTNNKKNKIKNKKKFTIRCM